MYPPQATYPEDHPTSFALIPLLLMIALFRENFDSRCCAKKDVIGVRPSVG